MIATVSTVKTSLDGVQRFVEGNLAGGVDHMVVFLDAADAEVEEWLATRPEVSVVVCADGWWGAGRPKLLNKRQRVNANLGRAVLGMLPDVDWVFHLDADEVARIDRDQLAEVPDDKVAVNLAPLEVVSRADAVDEPTAFKRLLTPEELNLLTVLGVLAEPTNSLYFRSHIAGKVGIRPSLGTWLGIHKAETPTVERIPLVRRPGLRMLHYESFSGEEFVRKWTAMVGSGPTINFGPYRQPIADAVKTLLGMDVEPARLERVLGSIYDRYMADPVDLLDGLGLLEHVDARTCTREPQRLTASDRDRLDGWLAALSGAYLRDFLPEGDGAAALLRERLGAEPALEEVLAARPAAASPAPARRGRARGALRRRS